MSVRAPMSWLAEEGDVSVGAQEHDPDSLLNWMTRVIRLRRETPELGLGAWRLLEVPEAGVFAHRCDWRGRGVVCAHNLAATTCTVRLDEGELVDLFTGETVDGDAELEGYGYRWFRVKR